MFYSNRESELMLTTISSMPKIAIFWQISFQRLPEITSEHFQLAFQVYITDGKEGDKEYPNNCKGFLTPFSFLLAGFYSQGKCGFFQYLIRKWKENRLLKTIP